MVLWFHIQFHLTEIYTVRQYSLRIIIHKVSHCCQCLCGSKRPDSTVPLTLAYSTCTEFRMTTFCGCQSIRSREAFFIHNFFPGNFILLGGIRQVEIPGNISDCFTHICRRVRTHRFKKLMTCIPQFIFYQIFQSICSHAIFHSHPLIAGKNSYTWKCFGIAIHIAIDCRPGIFLPPSATDWFFHTILYVTLPIQSVLQTVRTFPTLVFGFQIFLHIQQIVLITIYHVTSQNSICVPWAELIHFLHRTAIIATIPCMNNLIQIFRITQPTAFINVMSNCTSNQIIFIWIRTLNEKLGHAIANRSLLDMLTQWPPTIIIHFFKVMLRTLEQRNIFLHPFWSLFIGNCLNNIFVFHTVEIVCIMTEVSIL